MSERKLRGEAKKFEAYNVFQNDLELSRDISFLNSRCGEGGYPVNKIGIAAFKVEFAGILARWAGEIEIHYDEMPVVRRV